MKIQLPHQQMMVIAAGLVSRFASNCERIEIAGSLRRQKPLVGDVELIAVPTPALYEQLDGLLDAGKIRHVEKKRWGQKLRSFVFDTKSGDTIQVDLFIQPDPATFGVNMMIRTGSREFAKLMVTKRSQDGWMPDYYQVDEARVWHNGKALETPEEQDVFALWRMDYVAPEQRTADYKPVLREVSLDFTIDQLPELAPAHEPRFTMADAERLTRESATWPLPTFEGGPGAAARRAIEASGFRWDGRGWAKL